MEFHKHEGEIISKLYFDDCMDFSNGYACVQYYHMWNYMDSNGKIVSPLGFTQCEKWKNGTGKVHLKDEKTDFCNLVLPNGELLCPQLWFHEIDAIGGLSGYRVYRKETGYLIITGNGKFLTKKWLSYCSWKMCDGTLLVYMKGKGWNYINKKGKFISKLWFEKAYDFNNGLGRVKIKDAKFRIDVRGILEPY